MVLASPAQVAGIARRFTWLPTGDFIGDPLCLLSIKSSNSPRPCGPELPSRRVIFWHESHNSRAGVDSQSFCTGRTDIQALSSALSIR